jgi:type II secretory pathway predicted ATPase ExeA
MARAHARPRPGRRRTVLIGLIGAGALSAILAVDALASDGGGTAQSIVCPSPAAALGTVPAAASAEVNRELANLDRQLTEANNRLATSTGQGGPNFIQNAILGPLTSKRTATLDRITIAIGRAATPPQGLRRFAACALR